MDSIRNRIDSVIYKHLLGRHDQKRHGNRRGGRFLQDAQKHGGFTYSPVSERSPKDGFMLSISPMREKVYPLESFTKEIINNYLKANANFIKEQGAFVGGWIDKTSGKVYLDISINIKSPKEAERLCRQYNQLAYYDIVKGETVYIHKDIDGSPITQ